MKIDLFDKKILYYLDVNARYSATEIGKRVRLPKETVNFRIKRLLKEGYVKKFYSLFNMSLLGYYSVLVFVRFNKTTPEVEAAIINYLSSEPNCANVKSCEGPYDVVFLVMVKSIKGLKNFVARLKNKFGEYLFEQEIESIVRTHKFNQKMHFQGETVHKAIDQVSAGSQQIDNIDKDIIRIVSLEARMRLTDLAKQVGSTAKVVKYRLKKMEKQGIIMGYGCLTDYEKIGYESFQVNISLKHMQHIPHIIEFFSQTNACLFIFELLGKYDLSAEIHVENDRVLRSIIDSFKQRFAEEYNYYDVFQIYREYVIGWSPLAPLSLSLAQADQKGPELVV